MNVLNKVYYPLEPDTTIRVGDRVRSFDFHGDSSCYFVGKVTGIDHSQNVYNIAVECQVWEGKRSKQNYCASVHPPINGQRGIFGLTRGVQRIAEGEEA